MARRRAEVAVPVYRSTMQLVVRDCAWIINGTNNESLWDGAYSIEQRIASFRGDLENEFFLMRMDLNI